MTKHFTSQVLGCLLLNLNLAYTQAPGSLDLSFDPGTGSDS